MIIISLRFMEVFWWCFLSFGLLRNPSWHSSWTPPTWAALMHLTCANSKIQTVLLRNQEKTQKKSTISRPWIPLPWHAHAAEAPGNFDSPWHIGSHMSRAKVLPLPCDRGPGTTPSSWKVLKLLPFILLQKRSLCTKSCMESGEKSFPCDSNQYLE